MKNKGQISTLFVGFRNEKVWMVSIELTTTEDITGQNLQLIDKSKCNFVQII